MHLNLALWTATYYGHMVILDSLLCPWEKKARHPYIFCKFNPLNMDTPLKRALSMAPTVSVLIGFYCY